MTSGSSPLDRYGSARLALGVAATAQVGALVALAWWPRASDPPVQLLLLAVAWAAWLAAALAVRAGAGSRWGMWLGAIVMRAALVPAGATLTTSIDPVTPVSAFAGLVDPLVGTPVGALIWIACDLLSAAILARVGAQEGRGRRMTLLLFLWCPLLVIETAWHARPVSLLLLGLAVALWLRRRPAGVGASVGWASLANPIAVLMVPAINARAGLRFFLGFLGVLAVALVVGQGTVATAFLGLLRPDPTPDTPAGIFSVLVAVGGSTFAQWLAALTLLAAVFWTSWRAPRIETVVLAVFGTAIVVSPSFEPAHALWVLPVAALGRHRPWLFLTATVVLGYDSLQTASLWPDLIWRPWAMWAPPLVVLLVDSAARIGKRLEVQREVDTRVI